VPEDIAFIDTNILLYHLVQPDHELGPNSSALLGRLRTGSEAGYISSTVVFECIYALDKSYGAKKPEIADNQAEILGFPGVRSDHPHALIDALEFWRDQGPLSFADCFHLALAKHMGMTRIYSLDRKMNRLPGVTRVEPA